MVNTSYRNMKIEIIPIEKIKPYKNNAKLHPDYQIEQIANSIRTVGFKDPIALDADFEIIEGHGRYLAAKKLNMTDLPCLVFDDLTDAKKYLYGIVHNKLTMDTGFDENKLQQELEKICLDKEFENFDLESLGLEKLETSARIYESLEEEIESLLDMTEKRKKDQENKKPIQILKCPHCGGEWEK